MKQNLLGIPLPGAGWGGLALAFAPFILRAIGSQWPVTQDIMFAIAKAVEKVVTVGLPIDPVAAQGLIGLAGGAALRKAKAK